MAHYEVTMTDGTTVEIEADYYVREGDEIVFYKNDQIAERVN